MSGNYRAISIFASTLTSPGKSFKLLFLPVCFPVFSHHSFTKLPSYYILQCIHSSTSSTISEAQSRLFIAAIDVIVPLHYQPCRNLNATSGEGTATLHSLLVQYYSQHDLCTTFPAVTKPLHCTTHLPLNTHKHSRWFNSGTRVFYHASSFVIMVATVLHVSRILTCFKRSVIFIDSIRT